MKWIRRIGLGLLALVIIAGLGLWIVLPPVSYPVLGSLANLFPEYFDAPSVDSELINERLILADGYYLTVFAQDVPGARVVRNTSAGDLLVSSSTLNQVLWLQRDLSGDGRSALKKVLLKDLDGPHGLDIFDGYLYVAEENRIGRIAFDEANGETHGEYQVLIQDLPTGGNHWRKVIRFGPDRLLYVSVGSSCNVCLEADERRAAMLRFTSEGEYLGIYASGLRNSAGFDWAPGSKALFATDNGRDLLGDDFPPCELNEIVEGAFYGWPFASGMALAKPIPDPDFGGGRNAVIASSQVPVFDFPAHNAPLGMVFLRGRAHPLKQMQTGSEVALVALHGSWNRSEKDGYKVVSLSFDATGEIEMKDFLSGFLRDGDVIGRPAEISESDDQFIYISDDYANAIYRVGLGNGAGLMTGESIPQEIEASVFAYSGLDITQSDRDQAMLEGPALFDTFGCTACHVFSSDQVPPDGRVVLGDVAKHKDLDAVMAFLARPKPPMPPFQGSREEGRLLSLYLLEKSL